MYVHIPIFSLVRLTSFSSTPDTGSGRPLRLEWSDPKVHAPYIQGLNAPILLKACQKSH